MTFAPFDLEPYPGPYISSGHLDGLGRRRLGRLTATAPSSGTYASANRVHYYPLVLARPYTIQRFWWQNGATVGTNSFVAGIYAHEAQGPGNIVVATAYTLSAGTVNYLQYATPAVQAHRIINDASTTDGTSFTTASVTLYARPGFMYALSIINSKASAADAASTVQTTGGALSFTSRNSQTYGASTEGRVSVWTAVPTADVTATIDITFPATQTGCGWALTCFTNVDTTTNHGVVQTAVGSGNDTTPAATLGAFGSANNATFFAQGNLSSAQTTGTGFRELTDDQYTTPTNWLGTNFRSDNDTSADATITSGQWGAIAAEIKSLGTTWTLPAGKYWLAIYGSGTTATLFRISSSQLITNYVQTTDAALAVPVYATPTTGTAPIYNFGITSRSSP